MARNGSIGIVSSYCCELKEPREHQTTRNQQSLDAVSMLKMNGVVEGNAKVSDQASRPVPKPTLHS